MLIPIHFKSEKQEREFAAMIAGDPVYSPMLLPLALATAAVIIEVSGKAPVVTEVLRSAGKYGYASVHELGRGIDFRSRNLTTEQILEVERRICSTFEYRAGSGRILKALAYHKKGTGQHLHGQTPIGKVWRR
jgi:hypothetical protein